MFKNKMLVTGARFIWKYCCDKILNTGVKEIRILSRDEKTNDIPINIIQIN